MTFYATKPIDQGALLTEIMGVRGGEAEAGWVRGIAAQERVLLPTPVIELPRRLENSP